MPFNHFVKKECLDQGWPTHCPRAFFALQAFLKCPSNLFITLYSVILMEFFPDNFALAPKRLATPGLDQPERLKDHVLLNKWSIFIGFLLTVPILT
jgi:hypothetical protein